MSCRSREPGDLKFLNRGGSASTSSSSSSSSSSMFDLVLSRGGLAAAAASDSGLSDLLTGAAKVLKPGSGILVAAERLQGGGAGGAGGGGGAVAGEGAGAGASGASAGLVRGLTGLGGASASLALADLERALEAAPGFSRVALDVVCSGTDPHAVVVAFRDETSVFGLGGGGRSAALSAGTVEEDALAAALKTTKKGKSKKGFK